MTTESYIHAAAIGTSVLLGVTGQTLERTRAKHRPESAGNQWHRLDAIKRHEAVLTFTTSSIKDILDRMPQGSGAAALPLPCMKLAADPLYVWAANMQDDVPVPTTGSTHERLTIARGVLVLRRIAWREPGEPAIATVTAWPLSADGEASVWTPALAALPAAPGIDADYTLRSVTIEGGDPLEGISDLDLEFELPARLRYKLPKSRYPDAISLGGTAGICRARASWKTTDRSLLRAWGDGYLGSAIRTVEIQLDPYAQAAERGATPYKIELKCVLECTGGEDGRPGTLSVSGESLSSDGTSPVRWGYV